jgi:hypothetical protein
MWEDVFYGNRVAIFVTIFPPKSKTSLRTVFMTARRLLNYSSNLVRNSLELNIGILWTAIRSVHLLFHRNLRLWHVAYSAVAHRFVNWCSSFNQVWNNSICRRADLGLSAFRIVRKLFLVALGDGRVKDVLCIPDSRLLQFGRQSFLMKLELRHLREVRGMDADEKTDSFVRISEEVLRRRRCHLGSLWLDLLKLTKLWSTSQLTV